MDIQQLLPLLLNGRLGEREQALLKATQSHDPNAMTALLTKMYAQKPQRQDVYESFKRLIPAKTLGDIIKYFDLKK